MDNDNEKIKVKKYSWEELTSYCVDIYTQMKKDDYRPDVIISIARGGFFIGLILAHLMNIKELYSINASTNINENVRSERQPIRVESFFSENNISCLIGKKVLLVDDVFNTGTTLKSVNNYIKNLSTNINVKTACMIYDTYVDTDLFVVDFKVDYYSDKRCEWAVFPWETIE